MKKTYIFFLVALLLLNGCGAGTPAATPEILTIQYTAATQPWLADLYACAGKNVVNSELHSGDTQDLSQADMTIRIGETFNQSTPTYQFGTEDLLVIANRQNPLSQLSLVQVRGLFGGQIRNWKDVQGQDAPVQVWVFAAGEDMEQVFEQAGMGGAPISSSARLATGPDEMAQAIANDINSVGIITKRLKTTNVASLFKVTSVPVLATTPAQSLGASLQILDCMQK